MTTADQYKVKQSKTGEFSSNNKASPIDFEMQISLPRKAPPNISPSKRAFEKYKPRGLFSEFYGLQLFHLFGYSLSLELFKTADIYTNCAVRAHLTCTKEKSCIS